MFYVGMGIGILQGILFSICYCLWVPPHLNKSTPNTILKSGVVGPRITTRGKRIPKVLTDEYAYERELQEQGENRG